jgi:hypothetical protein
MGRAPLAGCGQLSTMKNPLTDLSAPWLQTLLPLTRSAEFISHFTRVEIPDLATAKHDREQLKREYGARNFAGKIIKHKSGTYNLVYTVREIRTEHLFEPAINTGLSVKLPVNARKSNEKFRRVMTNLS